MQEASTSADVPAVPNTRPRRWRWLVSGMLLLACLAGGVWLVSPYVVAHRHLAKGKDYLEKHRISDATFELQQGLAIRPRDPEMLFWTARALRRGGNFDAAARLLAECHKLSPQSDRMAREMLMLRANRGELEDVANSCLNLVKADDADKYLILEALAKGAIEHFRGIDAKEFLDTWQDLNPNDPQVHYLRGVFLMQGDNSQETMDEFRKVLELDPSRGDARYLLAGLHLENNQFLEADGHMAVLLDQQPNAPMVLVRKAKCLRSMAQGDAATVLLNKALAIQPKYPPALLELAQLAYHEARFEEAEQLVRESRERDSADRTALHLLVLCQRALGKTTEADANAKLEIKMDAMLERLRNITTKDLPSTPHDANLHAELGDIFLKIGQYADGERWYRSALSRQPNHLASLVALKDYYMDMGLTRQAEEYRLRWERAKSEGPK